MHDWFNIIDAGRELSAGALQDLRRVGFVVIPGPVAPAGLAQLATAYDSAMACASADEVSIGGSTTRVHDFANRGPEFDALYVYQPVLEACCRIIGRPFKLSAMLGRTLRPRSQAQAFHCDYKRDHDMDGWPMIGFILMVDEFRSDNGATRFVPGSHQWPTTTGDLMNNRPADYEGQVAACGSAGSIIVFNGSVWHAHGENPSGEPRRSIQGAYIRREARSSVNPAARMCSDTLACIGPLARYLLAI